MFVLTQIGFGSLLLVAAIFIQLALISWIVRQLRDRAHFSQNTTVRNVMILSSVVFFPLLLGHTVHIYMWAISVWVMGALPGYEEPIYFSLVTYTTVGYGDVLLPKDYRIFGAMAAVNGVLAFGLSTAFLVGLFANIIEAMRQNEGRSQPVKRAGVKARKGYAGQKAAQKE